MSERRATPQLSVIVPMLNVGPTIAHAIGSALAAEGVELEVLVVDDGSEDDGLRTAREIARRESRVRVFGPGERGGAARNVSEARNFGLDQARGTYVLFLDGDDAVEIDGPRRLVEAASKSGAACGAAMICGPDLAPLGRQATLWSSTIGEDVFAQMCGVVNGAHVVARSALGSERFDPELRITEDWDLWLRLSERGLRWINIGGPSVSRYRMRPGSATTDHERVASSALRMYEKAAARRARGIGSAPLDVPGRRKFLGIELAARSALVGVASERCCDMAADIAGPDATWTADELASIVGWSVVHVFAAGPDDESKWARWAPLALRWLESMEETGRAPSAEACRAALAGEMASARATARELVRSIGPVSRATLAGLGTNAEVIVHEANRAGVELSGFDDDPRRVQAWRSRGVCPVSWEHLVRTDEPVLVSVCADEGFRSRLGARMERTFWWNSCARQARDRALAWIAEQAVGCREALAG